MKEIKSAQEWIKRKVLVRDPTISSLSGKYFEKAKTNLITMQILSDIQSNKNIRKTLNIPDNYESNGLLFLLIMQCMPQRWHY